NKAPWIVGGLIALAVFVAVLLFLRSPEPPPAVISSLQITNDGTSKRSLVTDGTRLYFSEYVSGHSVLMQVSASGGETASVPISLDIAAARRVAAASGKYPGPRRRVGSGWPTHRLCQERKPVRMQ